ncbi:zf-HC2 domain-containing protein [Ferrimicrobium sp.]|uniref:zf-HC2 domain-containing protein n=1 Tax=Ferrimicrobium sp. TaxID=2926050 RepID=UPI002608383B|nr:zf-HC2 domain-containing protein [Ferrimicrobium sp.]
MTPDSSSHDLLVEYTLGALGPVEQRAFEEHLISCVECRDAVDRTSMLVLTLATQYPQTSPGLPVATQPTKVTKLPTAWLVRAGILVAGVAAGLLVGVSIAHTSASAAKPTDVIAMSSSQSGVNGSLALYRKPWGTQVHATFANLPTKGTIQMVVATHSGRITTTWLGTDRSKIALDAALPYAPSAIDWIGVYANHGDLIDSWQR